MNATRKVKLKDLTENLTCHLCKGYFIDASTIIECLHSFCRACIVKHLEKSEFCPVCDVQLHSSKPLTSVRSDQMLQEIVYKLVPGLFQDEMAKRRNFYKENTSSVPTGQRDSGRVYNETYITSEDQIQLSLEYYTSDRKFRESTKRYIQCPAAVSIAILKKFIQGKYDLKESIQINVMYGDRILPDDFLLMDIAYKYSWTQNGNKPLQLCYAVEGGPAYSSDKMTTSNLKSEQVCTPTTPTANRSKRRTSMNSNKSCIEIPTPAKLAKRINGSIRIPQPVPATALPLPKRGQVSKNKPGRKGKLVKISTIDSSPSPPEDSAKNVEIKSAQNGERFVEVQSDALNLSNRPNPETTPAAGTEVQLRISENGVMSARSVSSGEEKILNSSPLKGKIKSVYPLNGVSSRPIDMLLNGGSKVGNTTKLKGKRSCKTSGQSPKAKKVCNDKEISQDHNNKSTPTKPQKTPKEKKTMSSQQKKKNGILSSCMSNSPVSNFPNGHSSPAHCDETTTTGHDYDFNSDLPSDLTKASVKTGTPAKNEDINKRLSPILTNGESTDPFVTPSKICSGIETSPPNKKPPKFFKSRYSESFEPDSQITPVKVNGNINHNSTKGMDSAAQLGETNQDPRFTVEVSRTDPVITQPPVTTQVHMFNSMNTNAVYGFPMGGSIHPNMAMNISLPSMNLVPLMTSNYCSMPLSVFHNPRPTMSAWGNTFTVPSPTFRYQNPVQLNQLDLSTRKPVSNCVHIVPKKPEKTDNAVPSQMEPLSLKVNKSPKRKIDSPRRIISNPGVISKKTPIKIPKVVPQHNHSNSNGQISEKSSPPVNRNLNNNIGEDGVMDKNELKPNNGMSQADESKIEIIDLESKAEDTNINDNDKNISLNETEVQLEDSHIKTSDSNTESDGTKANVEDSNVESDDARVNPDEATAKTEHNPKVEDPKVQTEESVSKAEGTNIIVCVTDEDQVKRLCMPDPEKSESDIELAKELSAPTSPKPSAVVDCVSNSDSENNNGEENGNADKALYIAESDEFRISVPAALSANINDTPSTTTPLDRG